MAVNGANVLGKAGAGAAMGSAFGPWGTAIGGVGGALWGLLDGSGDNAAPQAPPAQFAGGNGSDLTNQLAAMQYAQGLQQQQAQNAREAAFYNQGNGNFDIANAAQGRLSAQIAADPADQQRQLAALGATNKGISNLNSTGGLLTDIGTRAMGPSVAEAQLRLGQSDAMNQQLAMARSGRSLGSGQAAMNQAAFNNAQINQTTNQQAAAARLQEQQNYQNMQLAALQGAGNAYGSAGGLAGQAGNQATTIRTGNEGLQAQNAALGQAQQQINNQTTGLYNQLGAQQQQLGMQANQAGQNAYQFGQQQGQNMQTAQLNANVGQTSGQVATNIANQNNANAHQAANMNMASAGFGAAADAMATANGGSAPVNPNNPSGSTSPYKSITDSSHSTDQVSSDENNKKNIRPMPAPLTSPVTDAKNAAKYAGFSPEDAAAYKAADAAAARGDSTYTANGKTNELRPYGDAPMDPDTNKIAAPGEGGVPTPTYAQAIGALNSAYRASQFAPTDVLNHVPGAGAGHSASQDAAIAALSAPPQGAGRMMKVDPGYSALPSDLMRGNAPMSGAATSRIGATGKSVATGLQAPGGSGRTLGAQGLGGSVTPYTPRPVAAPAAPPAWGDVFSAPQLDPAIWAYLNGATPFTLPSATAPQAPTQNPSAYIHQSDPESGGTPSYGGEDAVWGPLRTSDARSKTRIRELETQLAALSADAPATGGVSPQSPDTAALDDSEYGRQVRPGWRNRDQLAGPESYPHRWDADPFAPAVDLRAAKGYEYEYKDPSAPGAAPGRHVGPMAQDLLKTPAASNVHNTPTGLKVDTPGLTMTNTAALAEQQRKTAELERQLAALQGSGLGPMPAFDRSLYVQPGAP